MFEGLNHIVLSGEEYPIKCDLLVLEKLQEEFGSIWDFEHKLLNWDWKEKDGKKIKVAKLPDIHAVNFALPLMVHEGIDIANETADPKLSFVGDKELLRQVDIPLMDIAGIIHDEFARCFPTKNQKTT